MNAITLTLLIFGIMLGLMALRVPISIAMFAAGGIGYVMQTGWAPFSSFLNTQAFARFASYDLSVIPLFILMGHFATQGGISKALFQFAASIMRHFKGGLAMASVLASAAFGAICGSSVATAATITSVALPEMKRHGYSGRLSTATLAAGGTLGILIPPSVPLVIYAILTEQNIAKLFAAAMVPGLIAMLGYITAIAIYVRLVPGQAPDVDADSEGISLRAALAVFPIIVIFLLVFGGIYGGYFTPTEGAAVGAAATFVAALFKRELTWAKFLRCFYATAESSAMIFLIFIGADLMNSALALTQVPNQLAEVVGSWGLQPLMVVTAILLFYVVLGAVMDELSMLLLTIPIFFPMVMALDFGMPRESVAIWFGIMVLMTVGFGLLAPPVGLNVYVVNSMAKDVPISESYRGVVPFLISDALRTALLLFFPGISLWLVKYIS
ncbi:MULTISPECIES: TRAP transporter large permease [unclassified Polaromonas]|jgi:tripartite ATP-independent transporter DctM subunit|uniref:TRAP transporter large permease n=1 Tax=unclassified Polaromonas TaxID=2638319 RepID=UPI000BD7A22B|nr:MULTISPECIES: TRAP transporter large permease [unclassified Polaromonas]OYY35020.1 MAG: C4-dicarboxylate ABC transporter permease [Polaromonas sp. 35-63-35]OYZ20160.1 MAG: C4-dicarboxylate ABC transporter permease [Polaromonas sp. 16-63-31]OYZ77915.1 MAG: C4-dicarboxylate ABC transporter permease [Polaromonas sp. 24-63-21]OZA49424.1 MAG: C4-dicarboxylate ABC transporter permease [Polaromonas sp. 17-63-33]OZA87441.1 MAG: C4-dicarboxylate ABC transporter permease [Polaromonas sp. 39-63-25]